MTVSSTATTQDVTGLTNGTAYTFKVAAINAVGTGSQSADPSNPVTPATVPGAPTVVTAVGGDASASVSWTAPASDGGSAVTGYVVTPYIGAVAQTPVDLQLDGDHAGRDGVDQRHRLHVHGRGHQRGRNRQPVGRRRTR